MSKKNQKYLLIVFSVITVYFTAIIYSLETFGSTVLPNKIGSIILVIVLISHDLFRMTKLKVFKHVVKYAFLYGMIAFLLIVPHTSKTGSVTKLIREGELDSGLLYLITPIIAFVVLFVLAVTSFKKFQPKKWMQLHKIVWFCVPFLIAHFLLIKDNNDSITDSLLYVLAYIIAYLVPFIGLLQTYIKNDDKYRKVYVRQIIMLLVATLLILIFNSLGHYIILTFKFLLSIAPIFILYFLTKKYNINIKNKYYIYTLIFAVLFALIPTIYIATI